MKIDPERKAAALADLLAGEQSAVVADRYRIPRGTVRSWKTRFDLPAATPVATEGMGGATGVATVIRHPTLEAQQIEIGDLVIASLRAKIIATQRIAEHATKPEWLDKQTAAELATLFEAIDQSATGILDRISRHAGTDSDDEPVSG